MCSIIIILININMRVGLLEVNMNTGEIALICKSLSEENRVKIIESLVNGEKCACELLEKIDISQPTLSYHMKSLVESGLVLTRYEGKWTYYSINCDRFKSFKEYINKIYCSEEGGICKC